MSTDKKQALAANDLRLKLNGKLDKVERYDGQYGPVYECLIVLPAPDSYSSPSRFAVRSSSQLGKEGQTLEVSVIIRSRYWKSQKGKINHTPELWLDEAA